MECVAAMHCDVAGHGLELAWFEVELGVEASGRQARADELFGEILDGEQWAAFGFIAAESEVARKRSPGAASQ